MSIFWKIANQMHPKRCINQSSTFALFTFFVKYLYFLSKFTFSEMKPMTTICFQLTFLHLKLGMLDLDLL